jgi:alpha-methylacyl-CoA racemase
VLDFARMGPGVHAGTMLADLGADVIRVQQPSASFNPLLVRGRRVLGLDLKTPEHQAVALRLVAAADVLVEGFRPGVMERLGLGPRECHALNPGLIYGRMTGWGQSGPLAGAAGHDLNYLAVTGVLDAIGESGGGPVPPLNLVGDYGGGSMMLLAGILAALVRRAVCGEGDVIDAAIVDGVSMLAQPIWALRAAGAWHDGRGSNLLDGGCPYYTTYHCSDGGYVAVAALEDEFYRTFLDGLGLSSPSWGDRTDPATWPAQRQAFAAAFASRGRDEWADRFTGTDACVTPVLNFAEAAAFPPLAAREVFVDVSGTVQPASAPRLASAREAVRLVAAREVTDMDALAAQWEHLAAVRS